MAAAAVPLADLFTAQDWLALLDVSLTGIHLVRPVYGPAEVGITDFALEYLNPAAQRMAGLSEQPGGTLLGRFPHTVAAGIFAYYQRVFETGEMLAYAVSYQADGLDNYFQLQARRSGERLVVSFTDTSDQDRSAVEAALRESQARERTAHAEAEAQRQRLHDILLELPAQVAINRGPAHVYAFVNPRYQQLFPDRSLLGQPVRLALPELVGQPYYAQLDHVYQTGESFYGPALPAPVFVAETGQIETRYYDVFFQALRDGQGQIDSVLNFAYDVTGQVLARQQVEQLNAELEARVQQRTQEAQAARAATERQRWQWEELFRAVPAGICIFDGPAWVYQFVNPSYQAMFPGRALLGKRLVDALPEVADQPLMQILHRVYDTGEPFQESEVLVPLARTEGGPVEDIYFDLTYLARRNEAGQIDGFITYAYDVTEQVLARRQADAMQTALLAAAQRQVQQREELFQVFEQAPAAIVLLREPDHRIEYVNPTYQQLFPGVVLRGRLLGKAHPRAAATGVLARLDRVYQTGEPYVGEEQPVALTRTPGQPPQTHYFNFTYQPYREAGSVVGVSIFAYDVTAAALARRAAAAALERQREELQRLFTQAPVAIAVFRGPAHTIELANDLQLAIWDRTRAQALGRGLFELLPELAGQGFEERLAGVRATGTPFVGTEVPVSFTRHGEREQLFVNFVYTPLREADGHISGVVVVVTDVSEQVRARRQAEVLQAALLAAAERQTRERTAQQQELQRLFAQVPMAIAVLRGPEFLIAQANEQAEAIWGRPAAEVLGRPHFEALPDAAGQGFEELLAGVRQSGEAMVLHEVPIKLARAHTGRPTTGYYDIIFKPLRDAQQQVGDIVVMWTEATDQVLARQRIEQLNQELEARVQARTQEVQQAQAATERERALLQALLTQAPVAIALFQGEELRVTAANPLMAALWGYAPAQVLGRPFLEGVPELQGQGFDDLLRQVLHTQVPVTGTETPATMLRDGELKTTYYNFVYQPLYNAEGEVLGVIDVAVEVTEQVGARRQVEQLNQELETRVQERTRELREQQQLLRQILSQVPAYVATFSGPNHVYSFVNEAFDRVLAQGRAQVGHAFADLFPELVTQGFLAVLDGVYASNQEFAIPEAQVVLFDPTSGQERTIYVNTVYQPLRDEQGQPLGLLAFAVDVTEQVVARQLVDQSQGQVHELNQELAAINEELTATNEELGESNQRLLRTNHDLDTFVYTASHDLKAPITNIEGILNALRETLPGEVQQDEVVAHILGLLAHTVGRFRTTIDQLTDLTRLQQTYNAPAELLPLAPVVAGVLADLAPQLAAAAAQVQVEVPAELHVSFAPASLRSIVYNLLSNAVKYRSPERPAQVWLRAEQQPGQVVLTVRDNGLGLTESQQQRLFGVFQRLHTHVEGTGVGLYMIKRLIENAGARITVTSTLGVGSTFTVTFPTK